jgi:hypothetical protein
MADMIAAAANTLSSATSRRVEAVRLEFATGKRSESRARSGPGLKVRHHDKGLIFRNTGV